MPSFSYPGCVRSLCRGRRPLQFIFINCINLVEFLLKGWYNNVSQKCKERKNAMSAIVSIVLGYFVGCLSPSSWIGKKKNVDLTQEGTGNLGATNTAFVLGKRAGIFVMAFDILKSFCSYKVARWIFPQLAIAGIIASIGVILGHCYPVSMGFQGGKGLAAFGGLILAYSPWMFVLIVTTGILLMIVFNTGVIAPFMGCIVFPILVYLSGGALAEITASAAASILIAHTHWSNFQMAWNKDDVVRTREFVAKVFGRK